MTDTTKHSANLVEAKSKVDDAEKAVIAITETEKGIAELKEKYTGVVFEVTTTAGMDEAKKARAEIREPRYTIEHLRKDAKAPILALGRAVDSIAKDLTAQILELEEPIDQQIKAEEERKAEEKRKAEEAERNRIQAHRNNIDSLRLAVDKVCSNHKLDPDDVDKLITVHESMPVTDAYEEFFDEALRNWNECLDKLKAHKDAMTERVAEEQRQRERDAELEQLRKEKAEREEAERKERERKAAIKAEMDRKAAAIPPVEEQLGGGSITEDPDDKPNYTNEPVPRPHEMPVGMTDVPPHRPQPPAFETDPITAPVEYPGSNAICEAVSKHFNVPLLTAIEWMHEVAAEINNEE